MLGLERVDLGHQAGERLDLLALTGTEQSVENCHGGHSTGGWGVARCGPPGCSARRAARPRRRPPVPRTRGYRAGVLDLLLPRRCVLCRRAGTGLCRSCATSLPAAPDLAPPPGLEDCWSLLEHEDAGQGRRRRAQVPHHHDAVEVLGAAMAESGRPTVSTVRHLGADLARRAAGDGASTRPRCSPDPSRGALTCPCRALLERAAGRVPDRSRSGRTTGRAGVPRPSRATAPRSRAVGRRRADHRCDAVRGGGRAQRRAGTARCSGSRCRSAGDRRREATARVPAQLGGSCAQGCSPDSMRSTRSRTMPCHSGWVST